MPYRVGSDFSIEGGTISTNGFVGALGWEGPATEQDVDLNALLDSTLVDWSLRLSSPTGSYLFTQENSEFSVVGTFEPGFTSTMIDVRAYGNPGFLTLTSHGGQSITWLGRRFNDQGGVLNFYGGGLEVRDGDAQASLSFAGFCDPLESPDCSGSTIVATSVAEPTARTYSLSVLGAVLGWLRYRRSQQAWLGQAIQ